MRMVELSDTDIANTLADSLNTQIAKNMMADMQSQIDGQQMQIGDLQNQLSATQEALPPESQEQLAQEPIAGSPVPAPQGMPAPVEEPMPGGGDSFAESSPLPQEEIPGQQVDPYEDLLSI